MNLTSMTLSLFFFYCSRFERHRSPLPHFKHFCIRQHASPIYILFHFFILKTKNIFLQIISSIQHIQNVGPLNRLTAFTRCRHAEFIQESCSPSLSITFILFYFFKQRHRTGMKRVRGILYTFEMQRGLATVQKAKCFPKIK